MLVVVPATPPEPTGRANGDQSAIFRTLANPLRRRILSHLQQQREANSTSLARALGESTGTTSYHLRQLAEQGFIEEIPREVGRAGAVVAGPAVPHPGARPREDGSGRVVGGN